MLNFIDDLDFNYIIYDIETYPNVFTFYALWRDKEYLYEISDRRNDLPYFIEFLNWLAVQNVRMVGFNNLSFDYPVIHYIHKQQKYIDYSDIYAKAIQIINSPFGSIQHIIWENDHLIPQVDLMKIHHFDNVSRMTSLKVLQFNMRSQSVEDLPHKPGTMLTDEQKDVLIEYNKHDVTETKQFFHFSYDSIKFREILSRKYSKNFMNHNDTKIGKDYFIMTLENNQPGTCYRMINGRKELQQTQRKSIRLGDVILPYIKYEYDEFTRILKFFKNKTIFETKGIFEDLSCSIRGFKFDFGTGGIHGSVKSRYVNANEEYILEDWDVASYYPNLSITNGFHPAHLGEKFCEIYKEMYEQRKLYKKGSPENAMLKLALNGVYGDSNSRYSPFYDPQYTMSITINGQLLLCMIVDKLFKLPIDLELIQINTDGLTIRYPRNLMSYVHQIMTDWQKLTKLQLERAEYSDMWVRDVNNYVARYTDGAIKRKGAYDYELGWHQNHSALVIPKAACDFLLKGTPVEHYIKSHTDIFDFMLRTKLQKSHVLKWGEDVIQNTSRYYISTDGDALTKVMPPKGPVGTYKRKNGLTEEVYRSILAVVGDKWDARIHTANQSKHEERVTDLQSGWTVQICNDMSEFTFSDVNYDYYIEKAIELIKDAGGI